MKLFQRWHKPDEVAKQLIEGLENGTLTLPPPRESDQLIEEARRAATELNAILVRLDPAYVPPEVPSAEALARVEQRIPGTIQKALSTWQELHARAKVIEIQGKMLARRRLMLRGARVFLIAAILGYFLYLLVARPLTEFAGHILAFLAGVAVIALPLMLARVRTVVEENSQLRSAVGELIPKARAAAEFQI